jgi:hypothetical protein
MSVPTLDLCEYHDYVPLQLIPGDAYNGLQFRINQCNELSKPLLVGELGIDPSDVGGTLADRASAVASKLCAQLTAGVAGELLWAWYEPGPYEEPGPYDIGANDPVLPVLAPWSDPKHTCSPTVTKRKPTSGPVGGGTTVTVTGTNFVVGQTIVAFGVTNGTGVIVKSPTLLTVKSPAQSAGIVDVRVTTPGGTSVVTTADRFKFTPTITELQPTGGSTLGGNTVTIKGTGFGAGTKPTVFKFGTAKATGVSCTTTEQCTVIAPAHSAGKVAVKATVNKVSSPKASGDVYTYS